MPRKHAHLAQILARREEIKTHVEEGKAHASRVLKELKLFIGGTKIYMPHVDQQTAKPEERETVPPQIDRVQVQVWELISKVSELYKLLFEAQGAIEVANTGARANVTLDDGTVVIKEAPATYLMWLEKQLASIEAMLKDVPTLPTDEEWHWDGTQHLFITDSKVTSRTKKKPYRFEKAPATREHQALAEILYEDMEIGLYSTIRKSGAVPAHVKEELVRRARELKTAVEDALHEANRAEAAPIEVGGVFTYLLEPLKPEHFARH